MTTVALLQQQAAIRNRTPEPEPLPAAEPRWSFDRDTPPVFQSGPWQCSAASTAWVLRSLGFAHSQDDVVGLLGPGEIDPEVGLHYGDGRALVRILGGLGLAARNRQPVSFEDVLAMAGELPLAMGGAAFYHWVGVRGREGETLRLANPGPGWRNIAQTMGRQQFAALGPFAVVWVEAPTVPAALVPGLSFDPTPVDIAHCIGCSPPTVERYWPLVRAALVEHGITARAGVVAALATIRVEAPTFEPIDEYGGPAYWAQYEGRRDLGNTEPGDGVRYHGRGFIQLTGRHNYRRYGELLRVPLESEPDLALEPDVAARIFARYFSERGVHRAAEAGDWTEARRLVNGGTNGLAQFLALVAALQRLAPGAGGV